MNVKDRITSNKYFYVKETKRCPKKKEGALRKTINFKNIIFDQSCTR